MIRHAYTGCGVCHSDPSGGELLTMYGRMQGKLLLRMQYGGGSAKAASTEGDFSDDAFADFDDAGSFDDSASPDAEPAADGASEPAAEDSETADDAGTEDDDVVELDYEDETSQPGPKAGPSGKEPKPKGKQPKNKGKRAGGKQPGGEEPEVGFFWGLVPTPPSLLLGGSYRSLAVIQPGGEGDPFKYIPVMMGDLYIHARADNIRVSATAGVAKVKPGSPHARAAQVTQGQGDEVNLLSRTHWLGFDLGANDEYLLRFGRVNLPFGVRVPEHTLWAREATRTDRESDQQHGAALGYTGEAFRMEVMGIAGNFQINPDEYRERGYSLFFEYFAASNLALGASSLVTAVAEDRILLRKDVIRQAHGLMGRTNLSDWLTLLAEADLLLTTGSSTGYVGFAQFDIELVQGLHFMLTGEFLDQGQATGFAPVLGAGEARLGAWASIDWFFFDQMEFRIDAVQRQGTDTQLLGQLHFYL